MKKTAFFSLLLAIMFVLCSCTPAAPQKCQHIDENKDTFCDLCNIALPPSDDDPIIDPGDGEDVVIDKSHPWTPKEGEYVEPVPAGKNQITFYLNTTSVGNTDIWLWEVGGAEGRGFTLTPCDYGAKAIINIDERTPQVGFIVRTGCSDPGGTSWGTATKDGTQDDRFISIKERQTYVFLKLGNAKSYAGYIGGQGELLLDEMKSIDMADMRDLTHIRLGFSSKKTSLETKDVKLTDGEGNEVALEKIDKVSYTVWTLVPAAPLSIEKAYTVKVNGYDPVPVVPITYFSSDEFIEKYAYDGKLGVEFTAAETIFRLWAPTATSVKLNLFDAGNGGTAYKVAQPVRGEKGVWTHTEPGNISGKYYTYTVTTSAGTQEAVDPYAVSAGVNGNRGMVLDLSTTNPENWNNDLFVPSTATDGKFNYTDAELWEIHVRDFSNNIAKSKYKGKFLAFTEKGLTNANGIPVGVDYLKQLGITHVHLLPSYDYATVDEAAGTGFNWGYDPKNYNVPEGSYSTDPYHGEVRVKEFKQMVQALHNEGIGVIMDVVYNHTSGLDSNLNKIVPYYYYRFKTDGKASNGSGCGNETASDRNMYSRYMLDSVTYWMKEYNVDGFRFDLMGLHDIATMKKIEKAVHEINPNALIYGEGWTGGGTTLDGGKQSTLSNIKVVNGDTQTNGIAMFSDVIRDAIKGSTNGGDTGFATGAQAGLSGAIRFGVNGGVSNGAFGTANNKGTWSTHNPTNMINYASAHDNLTLWDKICMAYGTSSATESARTARNRLAAAIVQTSLGVPFMQAGEEMLRSKPNGDGTYNENSYNASDAVNNLKWDLLSENSIQYKTMQYYSGLMAFRKANPTFRLPVASANGAMVNRLDGSATRGAVIAYSMVNPYTQEQYYVVYNASESAVNVTLPAGGVWNLYVNGNTAGTTVISGGLSGSQSISAISCYVYKKA